VATTTFPDDSADGRLHTIRYGIRTVDTSGSGGDEGEYSSACMEFVEEMTSGTDGGSNDRPVPTHPLVEQINATLSRMQASVTTSSSSAGRTRTQQPSPSQYAVQYKRRGNFAAQLQLVRTLRPPPSVGFAASGGEVCTCHPPPYDATTDSFVAGKLRLQLRPLVATIAPADISKKLSTSWEIYHNVSPADCRGHYLLIPSLTDEEGNWRGQKLIESDCRDLVGLASTIEPAGSVLICYNSFGAGASQNHIHCHMWPSPPIPLLPEEGEGEIHGWDCYAASKASAACRFDLDDGCVDVSMLDYPCCCIKLSSANTGKLGTALGKVVGVVQSEFSAPHNVGLLNRPDGVVDAYVFVRSRERSPRIVPGSRSGASEAMGVFHTSKEGDIEELSGDRAYELGEGPMATVLRDISIENRDAVWASVKSALSMEETSR